jgi:hypothetical protein
MRTGTGMLAAGYKASGYGHRKTQWRWFHDSGQGRGRYGIAELQQLAQACIIGTAAHCKSLMIVT